MEKVFDNRWFHPAGLAFICLAALAVYSNSFHVPFQFDGVYQLEEELKTLDDLSAIIHGNRPVTVLSFALNHAVGGLETFGYHVVNTIIHLANAVLAYLLVLTTLGYLGWSGARAARVAFFTALIFAVHPVQTQAVTYIVQRMESLSSMFYLSGVLLFALAASRRGARALGLYAAVAAAYVLGFYSKEVAFTMPAAVFLYDLFFVSGLSVRPILKRAPFYAVLGVLMVYFALVTVTPKGGFGDISAEAKRESGAVVAVEDSPAPAEDAAPGEPSDEPEAMATAGFELEDFTPKEYLYTQFNVMFYYMTLLVWPANQNLDYDFPVSRSLFAAPETDPGAALNIPVPPPAVSLLLLAATVLVPAFLAVRARAGRRDEAGRRRSPWLPVTFFMLWFFVLLAPTSSFVPIMDVIFEHRVYLASLGFIFSFVVLIDRLASPPAGRAPEGGGAEPG